MSDVVTGPTGPTAGGVDPTAGPTAILQPGTACGRPTIPTHFFWEVLTERDITTRVHDVVTGSREIPPASYSRIVCTHNPRRSPSSELPHTSYKSYAPGPTTRKLGPLQTDAQTDPPVLQDLSDTTLTTPSNARLYTLLLVLRAQAQ